MRAAVVRGTAVAAPSRPAVRRSVAQPVRCAYFCWNVDRIIRLYYAYVSRGYNEMGMVHCAMEFCNRVGKNEDTGEWIWAGPVVHSLARTSVLSFIVL